jgi:hypothetical protein
MNAKPDDKHDFGIKGREFSTGIRLPADMAIEIKRRAHDEYRTFNSMLVILLFESLKKTRAETLLEEVFQRLVAIEQKIKGGSK